MLCVDLRRRELRTVCCLAVHVSSVQPSSQSRTTLKLIVAYHSCSTILWQGQSVVLAVCEILVNVVHSVE